ncbi:DUF6518 family protein [Herbidospora mongoliensis]|uniref:DUF6518 family protein n=1 Tax=Herbidospora mongoliensis TaxID=688067 RepID=UPI0009FE6BA4|nr:DUF6518 family protein [Herbidospora mongoliensis]
MNEIRWWRAVPIALVAGLAVGVLTNLAQGWLPGAWNQIANSGAVWSVVAFVAGASVAGRLPRGFTTYGPGVGPSSPAHVRGSFEPVHDAGSGSASSDAGVISATELLGLVPPAPSSLPRALLAGLAAEVGLVVGYYGYAEFGRDGMGDLFWPTVWVVIACVAGPVLGVAGLWWRRGVARWQRVAGLAALSGVFGMEAAHYAFGLGYAPQAWACLAVFLLVPLLASAVREIGLTLLAAVPCAAVAYAVIILPLQLLSG